MQPDRNAWQLGRRHTSRSVWSALTWWPWCGRGSDTERERKPGRGRIVVKAAYAPSESHSIEEIEMKLLLEAVSLRYGYDFRDYAIGPLRRSISTGMAGEGVATLSAYQDRLLHDSSSTTRLPGTTA